MKPREVRDARGRVVGLVVVARAPRTFRPGWRRIDGGSAKLSAVYQHEASGWLVGHCGHPTALRPYAAAHPDPARDEAWRKRTTFRRLTEAMASVEEMLR